MPRICHVHFCPNSNSRTSSAVLKLHTIPKGASQEISDQWIKFCGRKKGDSNILLNVCHLHFKDSDYNFSKEVSQQVGIKRGLIKNGKNLFHFISLFIRHLTF